MDPGGSGDPVGFDPDGDLVQWKGFVLEATARLRAAGFESPEHDARRIVEEASGHEGAEYHLGLREFATKRGVAAYDAMLARRLAGEPLQYVVGRWGFRSLDLMVDDRVLIPRPETEVVAGVAIDELRRFGEGADVVAVDLGTGSGAIGLSMAAEHPTAQVVVADVSADALAVARANLTGLGRPATRVRVAQGSWFQALDAELAGRVAVVVANPPYVAEGDPLPPEVSDWEPRGALIAGPRGTEAVEELIDDARSWLRRRGALVVEMAPQQTAAMAERARASGYVDVEAFADLAGRDRGLRARWPG